MRLNSSILLLGLALTVTGCASSKAGDTYSRSETRHTQEVLMGVVEDVRPAQIEGTQSQIGATAGTLAGGIAGSSAGQGRGSSVGAVLGAVIGGVVGAAAEEGVTRQDGQEITVKLENGRTISVVQAGKDEFKPGDKVRVLQVNGESRVTH